MPDSWRGWPYIWVSWLTGLLAGSEKCEWKAWYKSHYRFARRISNEGDLESWKRQHDAMVGARVELLRASGHKVNVEEENKFKLKGQSGTLWGQPDIVAVRGHAALVIDEKSGQKLDKDAWQVRIYMFGLPLTGFRLPLTGEVEYRDAVVEVPALTVDEKAKIASVLQMAAGELEPPYTPSAAECRYCEIAACTKRVELPVSVGETKVF